MFQVEERGMRGLEQYVAGNAVAVGALLGEVAAALLKEVQRMGAGCFDTD